MGKFKRILRHKAGILENVFRREKRSIFIYIRFSITISKNSFLQVCSCNNFLTHRQGRIQLLKEVSQKMSHLPCAREVREGRKFLTSQCFTQSTILRVFKEFVSSLTLANNNYFTCFWGFFLNKNPHKCST